MCTRWPETTLLDMYLLESGKYTISNVVFGTILHRYMWDNLDGYMYHLLDIGNTILVKKQPL